MNELQQVLLIFAIIVIVGLYLLQKFKAKSNTPSNEKNTKPDRENANKALSELGEAHIPVSEPTQQRLEPKLPEVEEDPVPDSQLGLSFGQDFDVSHKIQVSEPLQASEDVPTEEAEPKRKPKHIVLEAEDVTPVDAYEGGKQSDVDNAPRTNFGIPEEGPVKVEIPTKAEKTEPEIFAIIVMGTEEFLWPKVNQTLQGVGLVPAETGIFVKKDSMGNEIIRVANLMEPGVFPISEPTNNDHKVAGMILILELPTTVKAPAVMHDMIMMSRKISQRLNARLYDAQRHLLKESDLQAMRDAAVAFESIAF